MLHTGLHTALCMIWIVDTVQRLEFNFSGKRSRAVGDRTGDPPIPGRNLMDSGYSTEVEFNLMSGRTSGHQKFVATFSWIDNW